MIKKHQYCFENIPSTKAQIFMKFYMVAKYYLVNGSFKFHEDMCVIARARVVNASARFFASARVYNSHALILGSS